MPQDYSGIASTMTIPLLMNPHVGGRRPPIMGGPTPEEADRQEQGGGLMDIVQRLFGGAPNPMLEQAQQEEAQKQAMMIAGLQMLAGSSTQEGARAPGLMQILAGGALAGQQAGDVLQEQAYMQQQEMQKQQLREQIFNAVGSGEVTRPQLEQMLVALLRAQDYEGARSLSEYMKSLGSQAAMRPDRLQWVSNLIDEEGNAYKALVNMVTGEELRRVPQFISQGSGTTLPGEMSVGEARGYAQANQLMGRYMQQTADDRKVADLYGTVVAASEDPSPAGDLSLIFAYMKVLDPGSVVREGEFANAQNTGSIPQRVWAQYNKVLKGTRLTPEQRADFLNAATRIAKQRWQKLQGVVQRYEQIASRRGIEGEDVAFNYFDLYFGEDAPIPMDDKAKDPDDTWNYDINK